MKVQGYHIFKIQINENILEKVWTIKDYSKRDAVFESWF